MSFRRLRLLALLLLAACSQPEEELADAPAPAAGAGTEEVDRNGFAPAAPAVREAWSEARARLPDRAEDADEALSLRGLIAREDGLHIRDAAGKTVWRPSDYAFLENEPPATAHPALWRQSRLANRHGLFEVSPGLYQVRGYDLSNMSIIEGETGRIIIDPLTSYETAAAALALVERELGERPVKAIILTHSHIDHFGGVAAIASRDEVESGAVRVIAPENFLHEAVSENVIAGSVMARRADFMFGSNLPKNPRGHIGSGLGPQPAIGRVTILPVTDTITETGQTLLIDGVEMIFQHAPDTEAKAELTVFFPQLNAWCGAEIVSRTLHNLYTLRGAQVRDALAWSAAIDEALNLFGPETEVIFNSHHWPVWGGEAAQSYLIAQRDIYKYIHDQTLRLAGQGLTPDEIAEQIQLPERLASTLSAGGYYGTLKHNARAVYQRYFGWYDAVPAHLDALPRTEAAGRYVDAMGGMDAVITRAQTALEAGDFRWAAELAQHAVFADPEHEAARETLAQAYEQMGYLATSGPWRDIYLNGAWELRHGVAERDVEAGVAELVAEIPLGLFFDAMATRLNGLEAARRDRAFLFDFTDVGETYRLEITNGVLRHYDLNETERPDPVDATVRLTRAFWMRLLAQEAGLAEMIFSEEFVVDGDRAALLGFFAQLDQPAEGFPIITP